ncbi:isoleucine--tRNA ligase, mitochondrial [Anopheles moucheti]|uniref:isoleucine--tRNA ligase, mitochondrial n=1 Tax=Anopheles moucheti TaxID=186751 RepID=UPI0022F08F61|nr:isoleucine--tRNA ligase, mitochondrial [Anopheles moucheti]
MGHAVNKILKDLILKHKIISGTRVHYMPGWDCHGLPIELKAMEAFNRKKRKVAGEGHKTAYEIRNTARKFALETIAKQKNGFESWGVTGAWNVDHGYYRSLDPSYISAQLRLFSELYDRKLIYRDLKPVYWSPSSQSALAEAELEYDETHQSPSLYLKLALENGGASCPAIEQHRLAGKQVYAVVWTTTPWTLPANQAVCYNPALDYSLVQSSAGEILLVGKDLIDYLGTQLETSLSLLQTIPGTELQSLKYCHPLYQQKILPFLPAAHVKAEKGTGLVHTAPAHGPEDFLVCLEQQITIENLIDEGGLYNQRSPEFLQGKYALTEGNKLVTEALTDAILKLSTIVHSYPIDWRTKQPVMLRASDQWFIDTNRLKQRALEEINMVEIYPPASSEVSKKVIEGQLRKRPYWCISRQRAWGVPIPVLYDTVTKEPIVSKSLLALIEDRLKKESTIDFWWTASLEELVPKELLTQLGTSHDRLEKGKDILDIWFDSGVSWLSVLGNDRVADLYLEGVDQFTGWFQSSLLTSVAARGKAPYKAIFVHGFAVDENGMKMSKSLGNVICPKQIARQYGCDALRWWVCAHATQNTSIPVSHKLLGTSAENVQKLRGILKFLLGVVAPDGSTNGSKQETVRQDMLHHVDRFYVQQLEDFHRNVFALYDAYQHNKSTAIILNFCHSTLSGLYLHVIKDRLYCGTREEHNNLKAILDYTYRILSKVLWPIVPFLVEESWTFYEKDHFYKAKQNTTNVALPAASESVHAVECALELRHVVYHQQAQLNVNSWLLEVAIECDENDLALLATLHPSLNKRETTTELCELLQVGSVALRKASASENRFAVTVEKSDKPLCQRCRRYLVSEQDDKTFPICARCSAVLRQRRE